MVSEVDGRPIVTAARRFIGRKAVHLVESPFPEVPKSSLNFYGR